MRPGARHNMHTQAHKHMVVCAGLQLSTDAPWGDQHWARGHLLPVPSHAVITPSPLLTYSPSSDSVDAMKQMWPLLRDTMSLYTALAACRLPM